MKSWIFILTNTISIAAIIISILAMKQSDEFLKEKQTFTDPNNLYYFTPGTNDKIKLVESEVIKPNGSIADYKDYSYEFYSTPEASDPDLELIISRMDAPDQIPMGDGYFCNNIEYSLTRAKDEITLLTINQNRLYLIKFVSHGNIELEKKLREVMDTFGFVKK